ncbi:MAG: RdgB/HAM1 family non-canonical purine NTP pyrophosphatase [Trueperaceae bacterium]|nr:RdgB/HAM1 family non-canonical purine NTP pyrophosphatase [Trueperaceae bacterium]
MTDAPSPPRDAHPLRLVLATANAGKIAELRDALADREVELLAAAEAGAGRFPPEEGDSYEANALVKAAHVAAATGLPALADDSGLEVDALNGAPGLYSARFGGDDLGDGERIAYLLARMRTVPDEERTARFVSVLVLATPAGEVRTFEGRCEGTILHGPRGRAGFGYDPVFWSRELGKGFGQASQAEKRAVSHRGRALERFAAWLDQPEADTVLRSRDPFGDPPD